MFMRTTPYKTCVLTYAFPTPSSHSHGVVGPNGPFLSIYSYPDRVDHRYRRPRSVLLCWFHHQTRYIHNADKSATGIGYSVRSIEFVWIGILFC
jgi:hypothetical protein